MITHLAKNLVLWGISKGLHLPQPPIDRVTELTFLKDLMVQLRIDCVLDVGANRGQFAEEIRRIGYSGLIVSFEPVSTEFQVMQDKFKEDSQWIGYQIALGSTDESKEILIPSLTVMSSILEPISKDKNCRSETIKIRRLDDFIASFMPGLDKSRIFLKMDTQGYDLEVFKGASGCLDKIQGIQSELSVQPLYKNMPHYLESLETYEAKGFDLYNISVVNRISTGGLLELNCFMRRA
jgi:FkbM family methyltransferase